MPGRAMYRSSVAVLSLIRQELGAVRGDPAVSGGEVARQTGERGPGGPRRLPARLGTEVHGSACYRKGARSD